MNINFLTIRKMKTRIQKTQDIRAGFRFFYVFIIFILAFFLNVVPVFLGASSCYANKTLDEIATLESQKEQKEQKEQGSQQTVMASMNRNNIPSANDAVDALSQEYAFILFYRSTCPHCQRLDPVLKAFSARHHIIVRAYTTDGISLPEFPNSKPINEDVIHQYFGESTDIAVPVLFLMHMTNGHTFPVSYGEMSTGDLEDRMNALAPKVLQYEATGRAQG